jgi:hypothetical protein
VIHKRDQLTNLNLQYRFFAFFAPFRGYSFSGLSAELAFNKRDKANASDTAAEELELISNCWEAAAA